MNDFEYDCMQKKRIARSAHNHVNARRGKCKLPHEYKTAKELRALNGEVKTYNLKAPMSYEAFIVMPKDLQTAYITYLRDEFSATNAMISKMWGISVGTTQKYLREFPAAAMGRVSKKESCYRWDRWYRWLSEEQAETVAEEPQVEEPQVEEPQVEVDETETVANFASTLVHLPTEEPQPCDLADFNVTWVNVHSWEQLYARVKAFPFPERAAHIRLEVW